VLPHHLIFVDNGSSIYDEARIRAKLGERYEGVLEMMRLHLNVGYTKGMNAGLTEALSKPVEWLMTLSNDTELESDFFKNFAELAAQAPSNTGMVSTKNLSMTDRKTLDGAGLVLCLDGMSTARGQRELDRGQYDQGHHALMPNGVAGIYSRAVLAQVGLLDETFRAYCEDTDLGLRIWLAGWDCAFASRCVVYHARSTSFGEHSLNKLYQVERNHYWVAVKNYPLSLLLLNPLFSVYRFLVQAYAYLARKVQGQGYSKGHSFFDVLFTVMKAMIDATLGVPHALGQRRKVQRSCRRTSVERRRIFWTERLSFRDLILK
jgi:GT2 family glycosyltransferase